MSFSWTVSSKDGTDLLKAFDIHYQALGLASNTATDIPEGRHRLNDIREAFVRIPFKDKFEGAAQLAVVNVQRMLRDNLAELHQHHCVTCSCPPRDTTWSLEQIHRFLSIPIADVWRADGGF